MNISVIVSSYDRPDLVRKSLLSLNSQTLKPSEVVVADDGSRENIIDRLRQLRPQLDFKRLAFVSHRDAGFRLAKSRNNGVRASTGDLLVFTDQDIVFTSDYLRVVSASARHGRFIIAYPVKLDAEQTGMVTEDLITHGGVTSLVRPEQLAKIEAQYRKDRLYRHLYRLRLRSRGPKLRGLGFALWRSDYLAVNGFDENYEGWGNEDDDFCRRLYAFGLTGHNVCRDQFPIHLEHPANQRGERINEEYYRRRAKEIAAGSYAAVNGLTTPRAGDSPLVTEIE